MLPRDLSNMNVGCFLFKYSFQPPKIQWRLYMYFIYLLPLYSVLKLKLLLFSFSQSPEGSSIPSLCSPNSLSQDDEFAFMTMNCDDGIDLTMRAPYIPMNENDDLPLLIEDLMWSAFSDELSLHKDIKDMHAMTDSLKDANLSAMLANFPSLPASATSTVMTAMQCHSQHPIYMQPPNSQSVRNQFDSRTMKGDWLDGKSLLCDEQSMERDTNGNGCGTMNADDQDMMHNTTEHIYHKSSTYIRKCFQLLGELLPIVYFFTIFYDKYAQINSILYNSF